MSMHKKLADIQQNLKAPKGQFNKFGGYNYRSCEDILSSVKPLLGDLVLTVNDTIKMVGDRFYIEATASITDGETTVSATGYAREAEAKKGMDASHITGTASSYARKYALNGLLAIDDTKDADTRKPDDNTEQVKSLRAVIDGLDADKRKDVEGWIAKKYGDIEQMPSDVIERLRERVA